MSIQIPTTSCIPKNLFVLNFLPSVFSLSKHLLTGQMFIANLIKSIDSCNSTKLTYSHSTSMHEESVFDTDLLLAWTCPEAYLLFHHFCHKAAKHKSESKHFLFAVHCNHVTGILATGVSTSQHCLLELLAVLYATLCWVVGIYSLF